MDSIQAEPTKRCPYCGEQILAVAIKCKHCGSMLNQQASAQTTHQSPERVEGTLWFVVGAFPGCVLFGLLFIAGLFHYRGGLSSLSFGLTMEKMVVLVPIFALVFGLPAGLSFVSAMRKSAGSGNFFVIGGVVTVALALAFGLILEVFLGGETQNYTWLVIFAAITVFGGAALANTKGRPAEPKASVAPQ
jgi:hypothetical protein